MVLLIEVVLSLPLESCVMNSIAGLHQLWEFSNTQHHGRDMEAQENELTCQTTLHVSKLYNLHHSFKPKDWKLFFSSLESHLDWP